MRQISLKTFSLYTIQTLREEGSLEVNKLLDEAEQRPELYAPIVCFLFLNNVKIPEEKENVHLKIEDMKKSEIKNEKELVKYIQNNDDVLFKIFLDSYYDFNNKTNGNTFKNKCRYIFIKMHKENNISYYKMCKIAKINTGNLYNFCIKGKNDRLSVEKCMNLLMHLSAYDSD